MSELSDRLSDEQKMKITVLFQKMEEAMPELIVPFERGDLPAARRGVEKLREAMTATCDGLIHMLDEIEHQATSEAPTTAFDTSDV